MTRSAEILCPGCGQSALLLREPIYEGLRKTGEQLRCSSCGYSFETEEEVPWQNASKPKVFSEQDRAATVKVFESGEADQLCRHCTQYVVNPFMQWCALHKKEVEATDHCDRFERKPSPATSEPPGSKHPRL